MFCPKCGKQTDDNAKFCQVCGVELQAMPATPATPVVVGDATPIAFAGFGTRCVAWLIDIIVILLGGGIVSAFTFGVAGAVLLILGPWLYEAFLLSSEWQATVGKRAMSIMVTGLDGKRISFARATGRHFAKWISTLLLCVGYIMAAFTTKKQALHDIIAETLVVQR
jgi:uncharacterized RDD family membrane protein YckC